MVEGGYTPLLDREALLEIGYKIAIFPVSALLAAAQAMQGVYAALKAQGSTAGLQQPLMRFGDMTQLMGFDEVHDFERRWADPE
jgi:2-methylisocitrate lyase-like PEP mutase family enzyme